MNEPTLRTTVTRLFAALSALLFIAALSPPTSIAAGKTVVVKMTDTSAGFAPEKVTIKVGDAIEWQNTGASLHSVDANPANAQKPTDVVLPKGAQPFDSGFMAPGAKYSHTFTVPGQYRYVCLSHEKERMRMFRLRYGDEVVLRRLAGVRPTILVRRVYLMCNRTGRSRM